MGRIQLYLALISWLNKKLGITDTDIKVNLLKDQTDRKIAELNSTLVKAGKLQHQIIKRTTTYYIGKSMGVIK